MGGREVFVVHSHTHENSDFFLNMPLCCSRCGEEITTGFEANEDAAA